MSFEYIRENILEIREEMSQAAKSAGRNPADIMLVAATKMNDADKVRAAIAGGVDACGENRVQEMMDKLEQNAYAGKPLYFIGHLQTNKVKYLIGRCDLIQSVDSLKLAQEISRLAVKRELRQDILLEVNIGGEEAKSGVSPDGVEPLLEQITTLPGICVRGLMTIPPNAEIHGANDRYFDQMRKLFVDISEKKYDNVSMDYLSMGMSNDFVDAIRHGANMVRVGTRIFGSRNYEGGR